MCVCLNPVQSLTECLLKMTEGIRITGEQEAAEGDHVSHESGAEMENGEHSGELKSLLGRGDTPSGGIILHLYSGGAD